MLRTTLPLFSPFRSNVILDNCRKFLDTVTGGSTGLGLKEELAVVLIVAVSGPGLGLKEELAEEEALVLGTRLVGLDLFKDPPSSDPIVIPSAGFLLFQSAASSSLVLSGFADEGIETTLELPPPPPLAGAFDISTLPMTFDGD